MRHTADGLRYSEISAYDGTDMNGITERNVLINGVEVDDELFLQWELHFWRRPGWAEKIDVYYTDNNGRTAIHSHGLISTTPGRRRSSGSQAHSNRTGG